MARIGIRTLAAGIVTSLALASGFAQAPPAKDPFSAAKAKQEAADAQAETDVQAAIEKADGIARTFPSKSKNDLKAMVTALDLNANLSSKKRDELVAKLQARMTGYDKGEIPGTKQPERPLVDSNVLARMEKSRKDYEAAQIEAKEVGAGVTDIVKDFEAGRIKEAERRIADLSAKYPQNSAVVTLNSQGAVSDRIAAAKELTTEMNKRFVATMNDIQRSALPAVKDLEYAKDWKEISERRLKALRPKLTEEEEKLIRSLDADVKTQLKGLPLEEAVQTLSNLIDQKIYLDQESLKDQGVDLRSTVDIQGGVSARTALRGMLQSNNLTFVVRDNIIQVVSIEKARRMMVMRAYDVRDIVQSGNFLTAPLGWGPQWDVQAAKQNAEVLMEAITDGVDPKVWKKNGGPATITFHYPSMSLIISGPSEVHFSMYRSLYDRKK